MELTHEYLVKHMNTDDGRPYMGRFVFMDIAINNTWAGRIVSGLYTVTSPVTAENFRSLCTGERGEHLTYTGTHFHRIIPNFIVQGGGLEGVSWEDQQKLMFDDEPTALALHHDARYILQMANFGPDTNISQFCYMLAPAPHLNGHHNIFGRVVAGFETVDRMEDAGTQGGDPTAFVYVLNSGEVL
eukprot:TRINITY_DN4123_c0_g1_i1.p1 TRINITY_DN4123_c0_g1~~TRINITY_DN4123_c0_g1_i1.p1  ORF type:complete len:203 (+),score=50.56 TRINITY_DN4123_c0_g1_i1:54-611(+)